MTENYKLTELSTSHPELHIMVEDCLESTNTSLKCMANRYVDRDVLLIAKSQTGGRGRMGRSFCSPEGGIYMSLLLHPDMRVEESVSITTMAAVAVAEALSDVTDREASIKWVNDVYLDDRKVCGILTEAKACLGTEKPKYVIVGIGVNVTEPEGGFPKEIRDIACAVFEQGKEPSGFKESLVVRIVRRFYEYYNKADKAAHFAEYKRRMSLLGKEIKIIENIFEPDVFEPATAIDIDEKCRLIVKYQDGTIKALSSGEVSIRKN